MTDLISKLKTKLRRTQYMLGFTFLFLTCFNIPFVSAAQAIATVSTTQVAVDEPFQLQIEIDESASNADLNISALNKDFVYGRPSISNSTSIINGHTTRKTAWVLTLVAKKAGTLTIPSFDLKGNQTVPISITVTESPQKKDQEQNIQVRAQLNENSGFIGERFTYNLVLMIGAQVENPNLIPPKGDGIEVNQVGDDVRSEQVLNGRRYIVINRQYSITPSKNGKLTIQGAILTGSEIRANRWGNAMAVPFEREAQDLVLNIKEKPSDYRGFWLPTPSLSLSQSWDPNFSDSEREAKVGEPINRILKLKIRNITQSAMPNLEIQYPDNVRVYSDTPVYSMEGNDTVMTMKQVIIPRESGEITLPPVSINWFNTTSENQQTSELSGLTLKVVQGDSPVAIPPANQNVVLPEATPTPITVIEKDAGFWPWLSAIFASLWLLTLILYWRKKPVEPVHQVQVKKPSTSSIITTLMKAIHDRDLIAVANYYRTWDKKHLDLKLQQAIDQEMNALMASKYRTSHKDWQADRLFALLEQANQIDVKQDGKSSLKSLNP